MYKVIISIGLLGFIAACAGCAMPGSLAGLSAEQLAAMAKTKDAAVTCVTGVTAWTGPFTLVFADVDKGIPGDITVKQNCEVTMHSEQKNPKPVQ